MNGIARALDQIKMGKKRENLDRTTVTGNNKVITPTTMASRRRVALTRANKIVSMSPGARRPVLWGPLNRGRRVRPWLTGTRSLGFGREKRGADPMGVAHAWILMFSKFDSEEIMLRDWVLT